MTDVIPIRFSPKFLEKFGNAVAEWWNDKWKKTTLYYKTDGIHMNDPRELLTAEFVPDSKTEIFLNGLQPYSNDMKAYLVHKYILKDRKFKYVSDSIQWHIVEKWQTPQQTIDLGFQGDCEDASLLWLKLVELAKIPSFRCKICCGYVKTNGGQAGHAYGTYLTEEGNRWVSMDLTYYTNLLKVEDRAAVKDISRYKAIWFSFNKKIIWSQKDMEVKIA